MKKLLIFSFLIASYICSAYTGVKVAGNDPVQITGTQVKVPVTGNAPSPHDTCLDKKFSIVFYIIQDSLNSLPNNPLGNINNYLSTYSLSQIVTTLNATFARLCVSFEHCRTVIIPNYSYNNWTVGTTDSVVMANWYTDKTLNIYLPTADPNGTFLNAQANHSYAYSSAVPNATSTPKDFIVAIKAFVLTGNGAGFYGSSFLHAVGHYFGLDHTFAEVSAPPIPVVPSMELVDGSNSSTNGDGLTDTEADPEPNGHVVLPAATYICEYDHVAGVQDANNQYYTPPIDNIMSVYNCRCRFTQQQYNLMAKTILKKRLYLH